MRKRRDASFKLLRSSEQIVKVFSQTWERKIKLLPIYNKLQLLTIESVKNLMYLNSCTNFHIADFFRVSWITKLQSACAH